MNDFLLVESYKLEKTNSKIIIELQRNKWGNYCDMEICFSYSVKNFKQMFDGEGPWDKI